MKSLIELMEKLGIKVRHVPLTGDGGGLCTVRGDKVLFIDTNADAETCFEKCLEGVAGLRGLDEMYLSPVLREALQLHRNPSE